MKKISVKKAVYILVIIAILGVVTISVMANKNKDLYEYTTQAIERVDLIQTVSETGLIKTLDSFNISFELGGNIQNILVNIGDNVKKDQLLAELDHTDSDIRLSQANASLDIARANLTKLQSGATSQEIAIYNASYNRAKASYDSSVVDLQKYQITLSENTAQAQKTLSDLEDNSTYTITTHEQAVETAESNLANTKITYQKSINDLISISLTSAEAQASSINNALDQINSILIDTDIDEYLSVKNKTYLSESERAYDEAKLMLISVNENTVLAKNNPEKNIVSSLLVEVQNTLNKTYLSLNNMFSALENSVTSSSFPKAELDALKAIINGQVGIINISISSVQSANQSLDSAILAYTTNVDTANNNLSQAKANLENAVTSAKNNLANVVNGGEQQIATIKARIDSANKSLLVSQAELNRIKSPARREDINLYQAQLRQAQAELSSINNQIEKSKLKSPINGIISKLNFESGEQYIMGRPMATLISGNGSEYKIEVDISESDIPKVKIGDKALITLDAFGNDVKFHGSIRFIEPAETVIQDVIYYKVEIVINNNNENIHLVKPGMTANTDITTNEMKNIIAIPGRAIIDRNGDGKFVKTFNDEIIEEKKVDIGIIGDGGMVQIISGLSVGDVIVTFTKEK